MINYYYVGSTQIGARRGVQKNLKPLQHVLCSLKSYKSGNVMSVNQEAYQMPCLPLLVKQGALSLRARYSHRARCHS